MGIFPSFQAADIIRHGAQSQGGGRKSVFSVIQDTNQVSSDTIIIPFDTH